MRILLATGQDKLNEIIEQKVVPMFSASIVGVVNYKKEVIESIYATSPNVLIISRLLTGNDTSIIELLTEIKGKFPELRIIFLAGYVDINDKPKMLEMGTIVSVGIYDIIHERSIRTSDLINLLQTPKTKEDVQIFLKYFKPSNVIDESSIVEIEEDIIDGGDVQENGYKNVILVSSIKPGTGKSFVSTNLATAIAQFGMKKDGKPPKVAIIEGDLQNLSLGTLFGFEDDNEKNLKTVMEQIATVFDKHGNLIQDSVKIKQVNQFIINCFQPFYTVSNLYALVGSQLKLEEIDFIQPEYYAYLVEVVKDYFDVVIIDTNSSLAHVSTIPLLQLCSQAFYVLNLDFNNIRNNKRYQTTLQNINVFDKVKYVINEDIDPEYRKLIGREILENIQCDATTIVDAGFDVVSKIPEIPKEIFLNRLYEAKPIVLDDTDFTLKPRIEIAKIANEVWPVTNYQKLEDDYNKYKDKVFNRTKKSLFGK